MVRITCDNCGKEKPQPEKQRGPEHWILGWDIMTETPHAKQHSVRFLDRWDDRRAFEIGAIHFCSDRCRDAYVQRAA